MLYGKCTGLKDMNGVSIYEYDRVKQDGRKGTIVYLKYPEEGVLPLVLLDEEEWHGTNVPVFIGLKEAEAKVLKDEEADWDFVSKYDYNRKQ